MTNRKMIWRMRTIPVRKIGPKRGVNRRCLVTRMNPDERMIFSESLLERDFIRMCRLLDHRIVDIEYQPLCLEYNFRGKRRRYFPDFLIKMSDGEKLLVEVKADERVDDAENQVKFKVGEMYCKERGWQFKVVTEKELNQGFFSRNINKLLDVQRFSIDLGVQLEVYQSVKEMGPCKIKEAKRYLHEMDLAVYTAAVYKLLLNQLLVADLINEPLSADTTIKINEMRVLDEVIV